MKEITFKAYEDYPIHLYVWDEVKEPKAVVQLSHGMAEHLYRYNDFAKYLNDNGYIVIGDDHRGHGKTVKSLDDLGKVPKVTSFYDTIEDLAAITKYAKKEYNLEVILFGHSYGSFLLQGYLQKYSDLIKAAILCGSAKQSGIDVKFANLIANMQNCLFGKDKKAKLIEKLSFGMYDAQFKGENKKFAWGNRDDEERLAYLADDMCGYVCSIGFYKGFFNGLNTLYKKSNLEKIRKDLPIFIISGEKDPVGKMSKSVIKLHEMYKDLGIKNLKMKLYKDARHEILNEIDKKTTYKDILEFIQEV